MKESYKVVINEDKFDVTIENINEVKFDYESYEKSLTNILEQAQKEFWTICVDFNRHQVIVGRNNLWVAVALIGAYIALYNKFHSPIDLLSIIGLIFCASFILAVIAFGLCLYGMPSRAGYIFPNLPGLQYSAYQRLDSHANNSHIVYLTEVK
jgi:hypothetical protein